MHIYTNFWFNIELIEIARSESGRLSARAHMQLSAGQIMVWPAYSDLTAEAKSWPWAQIISTSKAKHAIAHQRTTSTRLRLISVRHVHADAWKFGKYHRVQTTGQIFEHINGGEHPGGWLGACYKMHTKRPWVGGKSAKRNSSSKARSCVLRY